VLDERSNLEKVCNEYLIGNTWLPTTNFIKIELQDAPVFDKPVLRTIKSLKHGQVIKCANNAELKEVLEQAEKEGLVWVNEKNPTEYTPSEPTPLWVCTLKDKRLAYFSKQPSDYTILPASKFVEVPQEKEEPITETQKDDCKAADERIKELERICELRLQDNDGLADECDKWKTMLTATNQHIDKLRDICQIALSTGSKEIMQSVLKSIATGEI